MISVVIATHGQMAHGLLDSIKMLSGEHEHLYTISFTEEKGIDDLREQFQNVMKEIDNDHQWVILCDILGGSPFKIASEFSYKNDNVVVYYGVNLPLSIQALMSRDSGDLNDLIAMLNESLADMIGQSSI